MRCAFAAVFVAAISAEATAAFAADPLTCNEFRTRLAQAIRDGGDKVAQPTDYKVGFQRDGLIRYEFADIVGLDGSMRCLEPDRFESIAVGADLEVASDAEAGQRIFRLLSLAAAIVCAVEKTTVKVCAATVKSLTDKSMREFRAAKARGEKRPGGDAEKDFVSGSQATLSVVPGGMLFTFYGKRL